MRHHNRLVLWPARRLLVILLVVGVGNACNGGASTPRVADAEIDALFAEWNTPDSAVSQVFVPGSASTLVFDDGSTMLTHDEEPEE